MYITASISRRHALKVMSSNHRAPLNDWIFRVQAERLPLKFWSSSFVFFGCLKLDVQLESPKFPFIMTTMLLTSYVFSINILRTIDEETYIHICWALLYDLLIKTRTIQLLTVSEPLIIDQVNFLITFGKINWFLLLHCLR